MFLKTGGSASLDLSETKSLWEIQWSNPRKGGPLETGSVAVVNGGDMRSLGAPPKDKGLDWVALLKPADPNRVYPPGADAGADQVIILPKGENNATVKLLAKVAAAGKPDAEVSSIRRKESGPGEVTFENPNITATSATFTGAGTYGIQLVATHGEKTGRGLITVIIEPFAATITKRFHPVEDVYLEGDVGKNDKYLKVKGTRRIAYLKFEVKDLPSKVLSATLRLAENGNSGSGTLNILRGKSHEWSEAAFDKASAPAAGEVVGIRTGSTSGEYISIPVDALVTGNGTVTAILKLEKDGDDIWFGSNESDKKPELIVVAEDPEKL